jgi:hypothetical protein
MSKNKPEITHVEIYEFDTYSQSAHPFKMDRDWMKYSFPLISPNGNLLSITDSYETVVSDITNQNEVSLPVSGSYYLWSSNSTYLAILDHDNNLYLFNAAKFKVAEIQLIYTLPPNEYLVDWAWLPDNQHIALITNNGTKSFVSVLSIVDRTVRSVDLPLLKDYDATSVSY